MAEADPTERFLRSLPRLKAGESFRFCCGPTVVCFNECCADLNLPLGPYDVLRLRRSLHMTSREFLQGFTRVEVDPGGGFPCVFMTMRDDERRSCPLVRESGCSVYADRPAACRAYPLGRGVGVGEGGRVSEQFVVVREEHCRGFETGPSWSIDEWLRDQGVDEYLPYIDSYTGLTARWSEHGRSLTKEQFALVFLALYRLDEFPRFIEHHEILDGLELSASRKASILEDEAERLSFAIRWIESLGRMSE